MLRFAGRVALLVGAAAFALPSVAQAQIYGVKLKDPHAVKRFASTCVVVDGVTLVAGEVKAGVTLEGGRINYQGNDGNNEFWAVNNADPTAIPYDVVDGNRVANRVKNGVLSFKGKEI